MALRFSIVVLLLLCIQPATARMYQWIDPASGRTQLSGTPPTWYRSGGDNPRVFVFENGQLIDDTGRPVDEAKRQRLRQEALVRAEEDREAARRKAESAALLRNQAEDSGVVPPAPPLPVLPDEEPAAAEAMEEGPPGVPELTEQDVTELRALISEWEARNQSRARELVTPQAESDREAESRETLRQFLEQQETGH